VVRLGGAEYRVSIGWAMNVIQAGAICFRGRKVKIATITLAITAALCLSAYGQARQKQPSRFYVFGEYDYYTDSSDLRGGGAGLGWNINRYVGLQAGAQILNSAIKNVGNSGYDFAANSTIVYGEAKLSLPVTGSFSVYGTAGLANGDSEAVLTSLSTSSGFSASQNATGYRVGVGAEYWITRHIGLRASWHQQNVGGVMGDLGAGIAFRF